LREYLKKEIAKCLDLINNVNKYRFGVKLEPRLPEHGKKEYYVEKGKLSWAAF